jgi:hypothetical protein
MSLPYLAARSAGGNADLGAEHQEQNAKGGDHASEWTGEHHADEKRNV